MENLDINALKANLDSINSAFAASLVAKQNEDAYKVTRHPTHLTNMLKWEAFRDVNKFDK